MTAKTTSDKLIESMKGKVFEKSIPFQDLSLYDKKVQIIRMRYEGQALRIRYTGRPLDGSLPVEAKLEDYYIFHRNKSCHTL